MILEHNFKRGYGQSAVLLKVAVFSIKTDGWVFLISSAAILISLGDDIGTSSGFSGALNTSTSRTIPKSAMPTKARRADISGATSLTNLHNLQLR